MMTPEDLVKMRQALHMPLHTAWESMSLTRDMLATLLASTTQPNAPSTSNPALPPLVPSLATNSSEAPITKIVATTAEGSAPLPGVHTFNTQVVIGSKDESLRKASSIFSDAAERMERGRQKAEKYWVDALKIRRSNWGIIPAPLPYGAAMGKGADKTSKDFLISFGLEESSAVFKRKALGLLNQLDGGKEDIIFPQLPRTRLLISLVTTADDGTKKYICNSFVGTDKATLDGQLRAAQQQVTEQEIYTFLVKEASQLPTASARITERQIIVDAARGTELTFELVDSELMAKRPTHDPEGIKCDLIYYALYALFIRAQHDLKRRRLGNLNVANASTPQSQAHILQPIIDILQYETFCKRLKIEIDAAASALSAVSVPTTLRFNPVGAVAVDLLRILSEDAGANVGGETILRIDNQHTLRMIMVAPATLTVLLAHATLTISSLPQFRQLLADEIQRCLLSRICDAGKQLCEAVNGTWYVDLDRCIGKWEGGAVNVKVHYSQDSVIQCMIFRLGRSNRRPEPLRYTGHTTTPLLAWVSQNIQEAVAAKP
ncbi:hypothetical protein HGRIS_009558 [Hohenbuehelia grisea]|uniref:Mediator of RNA polymerase II transcription subunit 17 n=1 Tax=Hohenbuehelia grisea TaxID=104357 RepID=A0ABR3J1T5_9AGAR